jgi:hypothetical protein
MKKLLLSLAWFSSSTLAMAQVDTAKAKTPFQGLDQTWHNGSDRRDSAVLASKYVTWSIMMDANYTYSFANPIDNTVIGSTALARDNEVQVALGVIGGEFNYKGARGKMFVQMGTNTTVIPRNDFSAYRGQYQLHNVYRYLAEAYGGYHFDKWRGINVDLGMFVSYIGLNSYYKVENWEYQASFTSDNTPWFFNGMRIQIFPTKHLKIEPWIINGWQSYAKYNRMPGLGGNITWIPTDNIKLLTNNYWGTDAAGLPHRTRVHSDNSLLVRYYNNPRSKGISRVAFSLTIDFGREKGEGVNGFHSDAAKGPAQFFVSSMFYNRVWFHQNKFAWTVGGGTINNPGRYLVLYPTGDASPLPNPDNPLVTEGTHPFDTSAGSQFKGWDVSTNLDWMPNQSITWRIEYVHRHSSVPYFAGHGGVTSPTGFTTTVLPPGWAPDLVNTENRVILGMLFRM